MVLMQRSADELFFHAPAHSRQDDRFFIRLHGWFQDQKYFYIAMDYYPLGDLGTCLPEPQTLPESEAKEVASDINKALSMMHNYHFTHRDLKPSVTILHL